MKRKTRNAVLLGVMLFSVGMYAGCAGYASGGSDAFNPAEEIGVISREEGSGTRSAFAAAFGIVSQNANGEPVDDITRTAVVTNSTAVMLGIVSADRYAIGYTSLGMLNDSVKAVSIDGIMPTVENIRNGAYPAVRGLSIVTRSGAGSAVQDFIGFIFSADGQRIIESYGYAAPAPAQKYADRRVSGRITISGSSSVAPVMEKLIEAYSEINPGITVELHQSDSSTGIANAADNTCDIGMTSRSLTCSEKSMGIAEQVIALDGIAVIVNKENPVNDISSQKVRAMFSGEISEWCDMDK